MFVFLAHAFANESVKLRHRYTVPCWSSQIERVDLAPAYPLTHGTWMHCWLASDTFDREEGVIWHFSLSYSQVFSVRLYPY
jgi:hypothetical protein